MSSEELDELISSITQLTLDGKPPWWFDTLSFGRQAAPRARESVTCEPCRSGGGPQDCVRPCVTYSRPRGERLFG